MDFLSWILFFYLSEVSLLFDDVFLLQAKKIELWKIEKSCVLFTFYLNSEIIF